MAKTTDRTQILADAAADGSEAGTPLTTALQDWRDHLTGEVQRRRKSPATKAIYLAGAERFVAFVKGAGMPPTVEGIRREHIEAWLASLGHRKPATADTYRRAVARWFGWLVEDDLIAESPAANVKAIPIPEAPPPVLGPEQIRAILAACTGRDFEARRDTAIVWLLLCGLRRGELAGLKIDDVQRRERRMVVTGKSNRTRVVPFLSHEVDGALRRYERERERQHAAHRTNAYLVGWKGALSGDGIRQAVERRAGQAGVQGVFAHLFRHSAAHAALKAGLQESDAMQIFGWRSSAMVRRYGASAAAQRAREHAQRLDIYGDV